MGGVDPGEGAEAGPDVARRQVPTWPGGKSLAPSGTPPEGRLAEDSPLLTMRFANRHLQDPDFPIFSETCELRPRTGSGKRPRMPVARVPRRAGLPRGLAVAQAVPVRPQGAGDRVLQWQ